MGMQPHPISGIPVESIRVMWEDSVLPVQWVNCPNLQPKVWEFNRNDRGEIPKEIGSDLFWQHFGISL